MPLNSLHKHYRNIIDSAFLDQLDGFHELSETDAVEALNFLSKQEMLDEKTADFAPLPDLFQEKRFEGIKEELTTLHRIMQNRQPEQALKALADQGREINFGIFNLVKNQTPEQAITRELVRNYLINQFQVKIRTLKILNSIVIPMLAVWKEKQTSAYNSAMAEWLKNESEGMPQTMKDIILSGGILTKAIKQKHPNLILELMYVPLPLDKMSLMKLYITTKEGGELVCYVREGKEKKEISLASLDPKIVESIKTTAADFIDLNEQQTKAIFDITSKEGYPLTEDDIQDIIESIFALPSKIFDKDTEALEAVFMVRPMRGPDLASKLQYEAWQKIQEHMKNPEAKEIKDICDSFIAVEKDYRILCNHKQLLKLTTEIKNIDEVEIQCKEYLQQIAKEPIERQKPLPPEMITKLNIFAGQADAYLKDEKIDFFKDFFALYFGGTDSEKNDLLKILMNLHFSQNKIRLDDPWIEKLFSEKTIIEEEKKPDHQVMRKAILELNPFYINHLLLHACLVVNHHPKGTISTPA